ncbi:MAG: glycosyltransferase [Planctomycetes bacterium]|nr:glycosyltransferase [Planctomycetota bacterium]
MEAGQRQTLESLHSQIHQRKSGLRAIQNKLNGASMRRVEQLERANETLDTQVRQLSRHIAKSEKMKRQLREKSERNQQALLSLREGTKDKQLEFTKLRSSVRKLQKMQIDLRQKLTRAGEKQKVERDRYLHSQAQLWDTMNSVRWRVGDAFVTALRPSLDTLKLPFRLIKILFYGIKRRAQRKADGLAAPAATAGTVVARDVAKVQREPSDIVKNARAIAPAPRREVRVACILDEFSFECFESEGDWRQLLPDTWERQMDEMKPELLFVESAWKGNDEKWRHLVSTDRRDGDGPVKALVDYCRSRNIPTVFWNKEDPANYEHFIGSAVWFDRILTTDSDCIERYSKAAGHNRVGVLPFAAQPRIHNPIGRRGGDLGNVCFAGTWYAAKHDGRAEDARLVLEPALPFGLHIYDRMFGYSGPGWQNYLYPPEYQYAIRGGLPYEDMLDAYKRYHIFLNVNSVRTSPTMCSRRVFEILACGTNVVSAYAPSIENLLGSECVYLTRSIEETQRHLQELLGSESVRNRTSVRAIRKVMAEHTCAHRFAEVLAMLGMGNRIEQTQVACVLPIEHESDKVEALQFLRDTAAALGVTPVWLEPHGFTSTDVPGRVIRHVGADVSSGYAMALGELSAEYVFVWSPHYPSAADILADLVPAFAYFGGDAVCKPADGAQDRLIFAESTEATLGTTLLRTSAARRLEPGAFASEMAFSAAVRGAGLRCLATDTVGVLRQATASPQSIRIKNDEISDGNVVRDSSSDSAETPCGSDAVDLTGDNGGGRSRDTGSAVPMIREKPVRNNVPDSVATSS